jgi:hypothetical protein
MAEVVHLALNPVRADRADEFERFLFEVVRPAVRAQRPDLDDRWRVHRETATGKDVVVYVILCEGGSLEDWSLPPLLTAEYGEAEADRLLTEWSGTFADPGSWWGGRGGEDDPAADSALQAIWSLEPFSTD